MCKVPFQRISTVRYFVLITIITYYSCSHSDRSGKNLSSIDSIEIIDFTSIKSTSEKILLSEIAEKVEYIPLEYTEESMLGESGKSDVRLTNNYIFIGYIGSVKQFDSNGKFIRDLFSVGRGPGETFKRDFVIDTDSSKVYVYSNFQGNIQKYDLQGNFLGKLSNSNINGSEKSMFYFNRRIILNYNYSNQPQYHLSIINLDNNKIDFTCKNYYQYIKPETKGYGMVMQIKETSIQVLDNQLIFKELCCDTLFQTKDFVTIHPRYIINFGNKKMSYSEYSDWTYSKAPMEPGKNLLADFYETNPSIIFLIGEFRNQTLKWIIGNYNKSTGQTIFTDDTVIRNDIDNGPDIELTKSFYKSRILTSENKSYLCSLIWPIDLIKLLETGHILEKTANDPIAAKELISLIKSLKIEDNPVLMKVTLK
jgi:hypothetical protein